jgi:DNA-binding IclR family transcriptional regulator
MRPPSRNDPIELTDARRLGYSVTKGQLQPGAIGIAAGITHPPHASAGFEASIGIVAMEGFEIEANAPLVLEAAQAISRLFASTG